MWIKAKHFKKDNLAVNKALAVEIFLLIFPTYIEAPESPVTASRL